uniref:Gag1-like clamp domain-containing protein n=1 Tax=Candidozyma auris TaxID=498019 RepID=A0A0L0NVZ2_CANAR
MILSKQTSPQLSSLPSNLRNFPPLTGSSLIRSLRSSPIASQKKSSKGSKKVSSFFKKIGSECSGFLYRLRDISHDAHSEDEEVAELFEESGPFDIEKLSKVGRLLTEAEEQFLKDYKKYKNLNKVFEMHQLENGTAGNSEQDINDIDRLMYKDMNMVKLKDNLVAQVRATSQYNSDSSTETRISPAEQQSLSIGEVLWEYRRSKWLSYGRVSEDQIKEKVNKRREEASIKHIPKELYPRIYTNLVDKGKALKDDKCINLEDLIEVINEGWKKEERWTRAAEGLP